MPCGPRTAFSALRVTVDVAQVNPRLRAPGPMSIDHTIVGRTSTIIVLLKRTIVGGLGAPGRPRRGPSQETRSQRASLLTNRRFTSPPETPEVARRPSDNMR